MANMCTFNLRVFGPREERDEVAQHLKSRIETTDGRLFINSSDWWVKLWAKDAESACQQSDDALLVEGESKDVPGLHLAKELSENFPSVKIHVGGSDEEGFGELWELIGGEVRLLERDGPLTFRELGFGVGYWLVRDGQVVSSEQRQAWIAEEIASFEHCEMEDCGIEYTTEQKEQREAVIRREIEWLENSLRRDAVLNVAGAFESATLVGNQETHDFKKEGF